MVLFEATNGMEGVAYVRRYVWAKDEHRARELVQSVAEDKWRDKLRPWSFRELMQHDSDEFVTEESSEGWE
jgi:hypothetical protein